MTAWIRSEDMIVGGRLVWNLPFFLRHPTTLVQARVELVQRFERRRNGFLSLVKRAIYENSQSPYLRLLRSIGCEWGDLEQLVQQDGIEGTLEGLCRRGVYLTVDEFKGSKAVTRGSSTFSVRPPALVNPSARFHMAHRSSGSRGPASLVPVDLASLRDRATNTLLGLAARGGCEWSHAIWIVPGGSGLSLLLQYAALGIPTARWFSQVDPRDKSISPRYAWSTRALGFGSWLGGMSFPSPIHAPLDNPAPIFEWLDDVRSHGNMPHLQTFPSSAAQLCQVALEKGVGLDEVQFSIGGEPVTGARLESIRKAGASANPHYGSVECGRIAEGCLAPEFPDECHLFDDLNAVIQAGSPSPDPGLPPGALLVSSLRRAAPLVLLNVSMGDQAVVRSRACGCPLATSGWTRQVHTVRSFEKLTAAGMTFIDSDLLSVLEEFLPRRFGGKPTDYQLLETEDSAGNPRLTLLVSPQLSDIDPHAVKMFFLSAISSGSDAARVMALLWRDSNILEVSRSTPLQTSSGKILHLHLSRSPKL